MHIQHAPGYNRVNGVPTCLDDQAQNGFLRKDLGFDGIIVSDCDAIGDGQYSTAPVAEQNACLFIPPLF